MDGIRQELGALLQVKVKFINGYKHYSNMEGIKVLCRQAVKRPLEADEMAWTTENKSEVTCPECLDYIHS